MRVAAAAGLVLWLGASACSKSSRPWIDRVEVDAFEGGEVISLSEAQLRAMLVGRLEAAKFKIAAPGEAAPAGLKPWRVSLAAGLTEPELEEGSSRVALALDVTHGGQAEPIALTRSVAVRASGTDVEAMQSAIRQALDDGLGLVVRETAALIALDALPADALVDKRSDADPAVAEASLRLLTRARDKRVLPELVKRLKTDDLDQIRSTMGLLVELRAPESVNPLVEATHQRGSQFTREVVFAVGSIGGTDAEAYLDLVATGHEDALVRASAAQALAELRARLSPTRKTP